MLEQYKREEIESLVDEFSSDDASGYYSDLINELIDGYLPIYYNEIVKEWQAMPAEWDNQGAEMFGIPDPVDIYKLMTLDLYGYYSELVHNYAHEYGKNKGVDVGLFN
jgi:hypothetical protein